MEKIKNENATKYQKEKNKNESEKNLYLKDKEQICEAMSKLSKIKNFKNSFFVLDSKGEPYILILQDENKNYCAKLHKLIQTEGKLETFDVATVRFHENSRFSGKKYYYLEQIQVRNKENLGCGLGKILMNFMLQVCKENNISSITGSYEPHEPADKNSTKEFYIRNGFTFEDKGTIMVLDDYCNKVPKHCVELHKEIDLSQDYVSVEEFDGINIIENNLFDKNAKTKIVNKNKVDVKRNKEEKTNLGITPCDCETEIDELVC